jgi:hypothetical protein
MNLPDAIASLFLRDLLAGAAGRAFVLNQAAIAEATDEGHVFDVILAGARSLNRDSKVEDAKLGKMIEKHRDDEQRHAEIFRGCVERQGVEPGELPADLRIVDRIDRETGGVASAPIVDARGVMNAYLVLQVIEERALHQFGLLEPAMRRYDPASASAIRTVIEDEARHLKYCHAISKRYAPNRLLHAETLGALRIAEARAFRDHSRANMAHMLDAGLVESKVKTAMWKGFAKMTARSSMTSSGLPFTPFATATPLDRAPLAMAA